MAHPKVAWISADGRVFKRSRRWHNQLAWTATLALHFNYGEIMHVQFHQGAWCKGRDPRNNRRHADRSALYSAMQWRQNEIFRTSGETKFCVHLPRYEKHQVSFSEQNPPRSTFLSCTGPARAIGLGYSPCLKTIGWILPSSDKPKSGRGERHEPGGLRLQRAFFQNAQRFGGRLQLRPCGRVACHRRCMNLLHRCFAFLHCATLRNSTKLEEN